MFCVEISRESTIPVAEVASFCRIGKVYKDIILCEGKTSKLRRMAYSKRINELLLKCRIDELPGAVDGMHYENFCIRVLNAGKKKEALEREVGAVIKGSVNLKEPENEIRIFLEGDEAIVCRKLFEIRESFEERRATRRPFFSPTSLHPRLARAMVNLSGAEKEILDPFCGTGGILIEGALMGLKVYGSDIQERMIEGCKENLRFFEAKNYSLKRSDIGDLDMERVDAIVTDMPYGKSSYTAKESLRSLYKRSFEKFNELLKPEGRAVVCTNKLDYLLSSTMKLDSLHKLYVNKGMRRWIGVFTRI